MVAAFEWSGSLLGLLGAFLLATHSSVSRYGWLAFLAANVAMIAFASAIGAYGLLVQQLGFTCTSLLGFHRSWLRPAPVAELPARKASAKSWAPTEISRDANLTTELAARARAVIAAKATSRPSPLGLSEAPKLPFRRAHHPSRAG